MKKIILASFLLVGSLYAQVKGDIEVPVVEFKMKEGKGFDTMQANCLMCHSYGYMLNQGNQSHKFWEEKVDKMINAFKAPILKEDAKEITEYFYRYYGNGKMK